MQHSLCLWNLVIVADDRITIHTDGACLGNPGPGGWGVLLSWRGHEKELSGAESDTTNNRMELMAAIMALEAVSRPSKIKLVTDSRYVIQGINDWLEGWKAKGWKTASKAPVKNQDLWQRLDEAVQPHEIEWQWVKGHAGYAENERVDDLARMAAEKIAQG